MIILNKKRITLILSGIFLSVFVFILTTGNAEEQNKYISTVSLPASGKTIVIDAGHGVPDERDKMLKLKNKTLQMAIYQRNILVG